MSHREQELLDIIYKSDDPVNAMITAIDTIICFLERHESYQEPSPACFREPA